MLRLTDVYNRPGARLVILPALPSGNLFEFALCTRFLFEANVFCTECLCTWEECVWMWKYVCCVYARDTYGCSYVQYACAREQLRTEGAPIFVPELSLLVAGLGRRFLLCSALTGCFGGALGAEVGGYVAGKPPLWGKCGTAPPHYTLKKQKWKTNERPDRMEDIKFKLCYLKGLVSAVAQHVPLEPALTGGRGVVYLTPLPQTHEHLRKHTHTLCTNYCLNLGWGLSQHICNIFVVWHHLKTI